MSNGSTMETNVRLYRHIWDEILNRRNLALMDSHFSPDYVFQTPTVSLKGLAEAKQYYGAILQAFSDIEFVGDDAFGD